ncbi:hypothetical protein A4A58_00120 [Tardiphaga robiniae]|uniref:Uncharacterized protein n=1 Tax=Tardiphaga robiniae TaxID=943830 RepID=A0A164AK47_9BRAD|nr:hypothetical protein A4A58_00120 [Tardiphaga robiniae]
MALIGTVIGQCPAGQLRKLLMYQTLAQPCQTLSRLPASVSQDLGKLISYRNLLRQQKFIDFYKI